MTLVADFRILLLALWLGAAIFFSAAVAQSAFAVLPSREMAGAVVNRTLAVINYSGFVIGLILLLSSFLSKQTVSRVKLWAEQISLLLLTAACGFGQFVIAAQLRGIREQIGRPIDDIPTDDPLRIAFNDLHGYSVAVLSLAMIVALVAYFLLASRSRNNSIRVTD